MKAVDVPVLTIRLLISLKAGNKEKQTYIQLLVAAISLDRLLKMYFNLLKSDK